MKDIFSNLWGPETYYVDCTPKQYNEWLFRTPTPILVNGVARDLQYKKIGPGVIRVSKVPLKKEEAAAEVAARAAGKMGSKAAKEIESLRSQVAALETLFSRAIYNLECVVQFCGQAGGEGMYKNILISVKSFLSNLPPSNTALTTKAHDDKVAREVWKEAVQMVENHPSHLLAHSHTTESGPCDLCCLTRKFKDKAEQGGKDV